MPSFRIISTVVTNAYRLLCGPPVLPNNGIIFDSKLPVNMPYGCLGNDKCSTCMPCTPHSPCPPCTVQRQYSPWIQCPPKFGTPRKYMPIITTTLNFGCLKYQARNVLPTPPVLCSPPPYYPVLVASATWTWETPPR